MHDARHAASDLGFEWTLGLQSDSELNINWMRWKVGTCQRKHEHRITCNLRLWGEQYPSPARTTAKVVCKVRVSIYYRPSNRRRYADGKHAQTACFKIEDGVAYPW